MVALDSNRESIARVVDVQARILGASEEEVEAAVDTIQSVLVHAIIKRGSTAAAKGKWEMENPDGR